MGNSPFIISPTMNSEKGISSLRTGTEVSGIISSDSMHPSQYQLNLVGIGNFKSRHPLNV